MQQTNTKNEKRQALKELSRVIKLAVKEGIYHSVNEGLADAYKQDGHEVLKSYNRWKSEGFQVKKGSKALLLWGEKRKQTAPPVNGANEPDEYEFFPVAYVFSNKHVEKIAS